MSIADVEILTPGQAPVRGSIGWDESGRITEISREVAGSPLLDGAGELIAVPGFIDIHTHGANGADLSQATLEAVETIAEAKLAEGVTTFLPTTWTASPQHKIAMAEAAAAYRENQRFARAPGLHVEGPFLCPEQAGAQNLSEMRRPDLSEVERWNEICPVSVLSLAIELDGAVDLVAALTKRGIRTSAAHSAATYRDFTAARAAGLSHLTHYCNQMSRLHHREIGLVGAGLLSDDTLVEIICDRIHLVDEMIELAFKLIGPERLMLITDSMAASHLGEGTYPLHDGEIVVKDGAARIPAGNLAGSVARFDQCVRNVLEVTGLSLAEILPTTGANQARSLGWREIGHLSPGFQADITVLDREHEVVATFVGGEMRYQR